MKSKFRSSHIIAIILTLAIGIYMFFGDIEVGGQSAAETQEPTIAEREESASNELFKVNVVELKPELRIQTISMRGRTKADAIVSVRAQTHGVLEKRLVKRGDYVVKNQLLCVLEKGAREPTHESAQAMLAQAETEHEASKKLSKSGFATDIKLRKLEASLNSARAQAKQAELELSYTEIRASTSGTVQDPIANQGEMLQIGSPCVTLVDKDPMFFVGQISENYISSIKEGLKSEIKLVNGKVVQGKITFISPSADPQTRTFQVEMKLEGNNSQIRDGLTASADIILDETQAFNLSSSWLALNDLGEVGVKILDKDDVVRFIKVDITTQTKDGFWVEDVELGTRVVTMGQEYVVEGEKVSPVLEQVNKATSS